MALILHSGAIKPSQKKGVQWNDGIKRAPIKAQMVENDTATATTFQLLLNRWMEATVMIMQNGHGPLN